MKKLALLMSMLFIAGFVFSQNVGTTYQTGDDNESDILQTGGNQKTTTTQTGDHNDSYVNQFTDNFGPQVSTVIQTGNYNDADVDMDQVGGGTTTQNDSYIEQLGNWNKSYQKVYAPGSNSGDDVWGKQEGDHNELFQFINTGYTNFLKSTQTGDRNYAWQKSDGGSYHTAEIQTDGNWNDAIQYMKGAKANLLIDQDGDYNYAKQDFRGTFGFTTMNYGDVIQDGNRNIAYQYMTSGQLGNDMDLLQEGDWNYSYQTLAGNNNTTDFEVKGDHNDTYGYQTGDDHDNSMRIFGDYNYALIKQYGGDDNGASNWIAGDWNDVYQYQNGNDNQQRVEITGDHNYVYVSQTQDDNFAYLNMRATGPGQIATTPSIGSSNRNEVHIFQDGMSNVFSGAVTGDWNDVYVKQDGDNNKIVDDPDVSPDYGNWDAMGLNIYGHHNTITVKQLTDGNDANVHQLGNWNTSTTIQN